MDERFKRDILTASHEYAADVLETSCDYLQKILDVNIATEANVNELAQAWQTSIAFLRTQVHKARTVA